jgi:predicted nucleic acid-binding protein
MPMKDRIFFDTNVLVYLSNKESLFHKTVSEKFKQITDTYEIWISRQVLREYAVVISREGFYEKPLESKKIASDLEKWEKLFQIIDETGDVTKNLKTLILKYRLKGKRILRFIIAFTHGSISPVTCAQRIGYLNFGHSNLFRISIFEFRIYHP